MQTLSPEIISRSPEMDDDALPAIAKSSLLQSALNGLDANLNDELERYRHWQSNGQSFSYLNPFRPSGKSSAWSPVRAETWGDAQYASNASLPTIPMNPVRSADDETIREMRSPNRKVTEEPLRPFPYPDVAQTAASAYSGMNAAHVTANTSARTVDDAEFLRDISNSYQEEEEFDESSEAVNSTEPSGIWNSLMNPVGAISLMLLLVSSALIGFLIVDPSGLVRILKNEPKSGQNAALSDPNSDVGISSQNRQPSLLSPSTDKNGLVPFVPLAGSQSGQVNQGFTTTSPNTVVGNTGSTKTAPTTSPLRSLPNSGLSSNLPAVSYDPPRALRPVEPYSEPPTYSPPTQSSTSRPAPKPAARPSAVAARNIPAPAPVLPYIPSTTPAVKYSAPISTVKANPPAPSGNNYRVVVDGSYASRVQQVEKDAFVRSDGQAQVGAYQDVNVARQRANELRRQGIPARVN
jgi:hypothetical protein